MAILRDAYYAGIGEADVERANRLCVEVDPNKSEKIRCWQNRESRERALNEPRKSYDLSIIPEKISYLAGLYIERIFNWYLDF